MKYPALLLLLAALTWAQTPRVGMVQIFGARKVSHEKIRKALGVNEGEPLPPSKADLEERIESIDGVVRSSIEAVCCDQGRAILYVGIQERGADHFEFREPPSADIRLPEEVEKEWTEFLTSLSVAARQGDVAEDLSRGHSFARNEDVRRSQLKFVEFAAQYYDLLREVLRNAIDEQQRGIAAYVLGYSEKKKEAANDLQAAMRDSDVTVRNNAMRAVSAIAVLAERSPELEIRIPPTWFIEMLHSVHFTDRNKGTLALLNLTEKRDARVLDHIRERGLSSLIEMAQWQSLDHAFPSFILLGRVAGLPEEEIHEMWKKGRQAELIAKFKETGKRKD
ncbi:MAG: hypothetical protein JNL98_01915 [Bryobacterales bacterium]|nr:hypothetical protein [Bryobacterales bacterium]